jgi:hypothetical protein
MAAQTSSVDAAADASPVPSFTNKDVIIFHVLL